MDIKKILLSVLRFVLKLIGKVLLFGLWAGCELLKGIFTALSAWLKGIITNKNA